MPVNRRVGAEDSQTRAHLINAAAKLVREEGCAAVTAGRLAETFGLKRQIVHYYFGTIEDLFVAIMRSEEQTVRQGLKAIAASDEPLRAILQSGAEASSMALEFMAMSGRSQVVQDELRRCIVEFRKIEAQAIARYFKSQGLEPPLDPSALALLAQSIAQTLAGESSIGVTEGHAATKKILESWLQTFAQAQPSKARAKRKK